MKNNEKKEVLKRARARLLELEKVSPESEDCILLRELLQIKDTSVQTSYGTIYPIKSLDPNHPGLFIKLASKEFGNVKLGLIAEYKGRDEIRAVYMGRSDDDLSYTVIDNEVLETKRMLKRLETLPF